MNRDERLAEMARAAVRLEAKCGYPPQLLLAQWALESSWGERVTGDFNFFGITYNPLRHKAFRMCLTHEEMTDAQILTLAPEEAATIHSKKLIRRGLFRIGLKRKFASYGSFDEALADKTSLIMKSERYSAAFAWYQMEKDVSKLIHRVAECGYATARGYGETLVQISRQQNILKAIQEAQQECEVNA